MMVNPRMSMKEVKQMTVTCDTVLSYATSVKSTILNVTAYGSSKKKQKDKAPKRP